ncbi:MAG TPA: hypothetical protein VEL28_15210 [Candidatus Binatia bacterium]|nr:hypothetical protein [Candidatus Binatia bacterium]
MSASIESMKLDNVENPDVNKIASMGQDVLRAIGTLRDMLQARAEAIESCRAMLVDQHSKLVEDRERFEHEQVLLCDEYERREADLADREKRYEGVELRAEELGRAFEIEAAELKRQHEELNRRAAASEDTLRSIGEREGALLQLEQEFHKQKADFEERIATLDADREKLRQAGKQLAEAKARHLKERTDWEVERDRHLQAVASLERDRAAFSESESELESRQIAFAERSAELARRDQQIKEQEGSLELRVQQVEQQKDELGRLRQRWEEKIAELNDASVSLSSLQEQLQAEVGQIANDRDDILERFGLTEKTWNAGAPATKGVPTPQDQQASAAVERYQKLCRDARRRAIGVM